MIGTGTGIPIRFGVAENHESFHEGAPYRVRGSQAGDDNEVMDPVVRQLDLTDSRVASQVLSLQRSAYRVEAELIGFDQIPPLHESLEDLLAARLVWFGVVKDREVVAAIAFTQHGAHIDIDRLVVAPAFARRGYGRALVSALGAEATITVSTGAKNLPANRLYVAQGFLSTGKSSPAAGLQATHFVRRGNQ